MAIAVAGVIGTPIVAVVGLGGIGFATPTPIGSYMGTTSIDAGNAHGPPSSQGMIKEVGSDSTSDIQVWTSPHNVVPLVILDPSPPPSSASRRVRAQVGATQNISARQFGIEVFDLHPLYHVGAKVASASADPFGADI
ncbi:hypothetical protein E2562_038243 [Oryza meyeriana var. granulata]|uniref:Uncharacterized protein n=1 Tax=Oryza meyeriana var. granulata TaxID=110450 RepID=A0A6G1EAS3_9ORYZ|nr:hypothetical protein E2562_038243 [Oryza meyeriana var. granulata]